MPNLVIADVFDVLVVDKVTNDVVGTTSLQDAGIAAEVAKADVRGGKGNNKYGVLYQSRDVNVTLNDILFRYDWLALQLGQTITTGAGVSYAMPKNYVVQQVSTKKVVTLDRTPKAVGTIQAYNQSGVKITGFTLTTKDIDFASATPTVTVGDYVEIRTYQYDTPATTQKLLIDNNKFPQAFKLVLQTFEYDLDLGKAVNEIQVEFYSASPDGNFEMNTQSEKQAQASQIVFNIIADSKMNGIVGEIRRHAIVTA